MPKITESFSVAQPRDVVWAFFQDVPQVADCMPGVELTEDLGDGAYSGRMKVKLGPISAQFQGKAQIEELDEAAGTGLISAKGTDRQGGSRASARVAYSLGGSESGSGTTVSLEADITLQGSMAQFGRTGLIQEVSGQLTREFASCLEAKLGASSKEEAAEVKAGDVKGFSLFLASVWRWFKGLFSRDRGPKSG